MCRLVNSKCFKNLLCAFNKYLIFRNCDSQNRKHQISCVRLRVSPTSRPWKIVICPMSIVKHHFQSSFLRILYFLPFYWCHNNPFFLLLLDTKSFFHDTYKLFRNNTVVKMLNGTFPSCLTHSCLFLPPRVINRQNRCARCVRSRSSNGPAAPSSVCRPPP